VDKFNLAIEESMVSAISDGPELPAAGKPASDNREVNAIMAKIISMLVVFTSMCAATWCGAGPGGAKLPAQLPVKQQVKPAPPTPIAEKKEELGKPAWDPQWDVVLEKALPPDLLSSSVAHDVKPFCPRFKQMSVVDRRAFWAYVFQALAGAEAGLVPTTDVRHTEPQVAVKDTVTKRMVRSEGLLQLTYMDADRYGCEFDWARDKGLSEKDPDKTILQPENNLRCGVKIMRTQLIKRRKPLVSSASYWSTLQPGTISYKVFLKQMANVPAVCRVAPQIKASTPVESKKPLAIAAAVSSGNQ
jgi:hypothetical protein